MGTTKESTNPEETMEKGSAGQGETPSPDGQTAPAGSKLNFQAEIGCILLNKELKALMQKKDNQTIYAIIPRMEEDGDKGMPFIDAIDEIGEFIKGVADLDENPISREKMEDLLSAVISQPDKLVLKLNQAYLFVKSGEGEKTCEYAFNIAVEYNPDEQPNENTLFKVSKLAFTVWSCDRELILKQMDLYDLTDVDKVLAGQMQPSLEGTAPLQIEEKSGL